MRYSRNLESSNASLVDELWSVGQWSVGATKRKNAGGFPTSVISPRVPRSRVPFLFDILYVRLRNNTYGESQRTELLAVVLLLLRITLVLLTHLRTGSIKQRSLQPQSREEIGKVLTAEGFLNSIVFSVENEQKLFL